MRIDAAAQTFRGEPQRPLDQPAPVFASAFREHTIRGGRGRRALFVDSGALRLRNRFR